MNAPTLPPLLALMGSSLSVIFLMVQTVFRATFVFVFFKKSIVSIASLNACTMSSYARGLG